ncbi:MAG: two-component system response regulator [Planctomycetes bacterium]|jgi:CheY-like chemotaxis protein|nr:two-component system response regulator [Planctomycetota bacterium]
MNSLRGEPVVILLAEDDPGDQNLTCRALAKAKIRNEVRIVQDGEEALDYLFQRGCYSDSSKAPRPHILLLDLNMPKVDGRGVLLEIRKDPQLRRLPVVVLTTSREEEDILRSYDLGVNSYISKPVDIDEFFRVINVLGDYWLQIVELPPE